MQIIFGVYIVLLIITLLIMLIAFGWFDMPFVKKERMIKIREAFWDLYRLK